MPEQKKPKIVLVWGVHPNESAVTEYLAKKLKPLLELKSFDVEIIKYPEDLTLHKIIQNPNNNSDSVEKITINNYKLFFTQIRNKYPNHAIIDLHTTPESRVLKKTLIRKPKFWKANVSEDFGNSKPLLILTPLHRELLLSNIYAFEMPSKFKKARPNWAVYKRTSKNITDPYFDIEADLPATLNTGYLSQLVFAKLVHIIDTIIKTRLEIYHVPRTKPFKPKTDKETAIRIEQQRKQRQLLRERIKPK